MYLLSCRSLRKKLSCGTFYCCGLMAGTSLPPGFRFHPTDVELVMYYLKRKVMGKRLLVDAVAEVNIYKFSPWDLPDKSAIKSKDLEWFFFCPREKKYASGSRVKRVTENGYWKTTGKDRPVSYNGGIVGTVKTLIFHLGHAPKGERTDWVMYEYRILDEKLAAAGVQDNYVLCKVFEKNGPGPKNGAQYGAPFNEADWVDSDADDTREKSTSLKLHGPFPALPPLTGNGSSVGSFSFHLGSTSKLPATENVPSASTDLSAPLPATKIEELEHLLSLFESENTFTSTENEPNQDYLNCHATNSEVNDIYDDLADLDGWDPMTGSPLECSGLLINNSSLLDLYGGKDNDYYMDNAVLPDNGSFIELNDLLAPVNDNDQVGFDATHTSGDVVGSFDYLKACDFFSEGCLARADHSSAANQLPVFSERSNPSDNCLDILFMMGERCYQEELIGAHNNLDSSERQPDNGFCFTQDTKRGSSDDS